MTFAIISFGVALLFLGVFLVFSLVSYFDQNKKKYDFRNCFPYEINNYTITRDNVFGRIALIVSAVAIIFFYVTYPMELKGYHLGLAVFVAVLGVVGAVAMLLIIFVPFLNLKLHLATDVVLFASTFMLNIGIAFLALWELRDNTVTAVNILKTIAGVIALILSIFLIILVMNSKMKDWTKLEEHASEDGTVTYDRPRWFVLAYTEWIYILALFMDLLLLILIKN